MYDGAARYRIAWPGRNEAVFYEDHKNKLQSVASAIALHPQIIPLSEENLTMGLICNICQLSIPEVEKFRAENVS